MKFHYIKEIEMEIKDEQIKTYCDEYRKSRGITDEEILPDKEIMKTHTYDFDKFYDYWGLHGIQIVIISEERVTMNDKVIRLNSKLY